VESLIAWTVTHLGVVGVFVLMVPESACIPVPSEVTLLFAGFAVSRGWMDPWAAVGAATAGNLVGSMLAFGLGRSGRLARLAGPASCRRLFARHGDAAVFVARILPLARSFVSLPAGRAGVPLGRFVVLTVAGCLIWCAALTALGDAIGSRWESVSSTIGQLTIVAAVVVFAIWIARATTRTRIG
jgi:membrane protein DedA with SNARE-associated domain